MDDIRDGNLLARRWEERYAKQPDSVKKKLDILYDQEIKDYQLKVIKRKRIYPEKGDIFLINPKDSLYFFGLVINNHVSNINGDDLIVIMIFKDKAKSLEDNVFSPDYTNLLIPPSMVGKEYWSRGCFYTVGNMKLIIDESLLL
ncbi:MAG: immunity 26/phosphotriesterase HocA family protein [Lachnospiraceae bacterium]|nr:immunity 26/phosphotriesterase HocA family protein [Lachnospiraceae bacterium]